MADNPPATPQPRTVALQVLQDEASRNSPWAVVMSHFDTLYKPGLCARRRTTHGQLRWATRSLLRTIWALTLGTSALPVKPGIEVLAWADFAATRSWCPIGDFE